MKEAVKALKDKGYKNIGKSIFGADMFEKGNTVIYINKVVFKKRKKAETFEEISKRLHSTNLPVLNN